MVSNGIESVVGEDMASIVRGLSPFALPRPPFSVRVWSPQHGIFDLVCLFSTGEWGHTQ